MFKQINDIVYMMLRHRIDNKTGQTCTTSSSGSADRAPCRTRSSAHLAVLKTESFSQLAGVYSADTATTAAHTGCINNVTIPLLTRSHLSSFFTDKLCYVITLQFII
ncbi:hypothetical protein FE839_01495 [Klebsiella indica]|uniref:Uncharacterized protein n=1 Tax=Klebsiella indica TaxID=2582917 RepID=A0A5R9LR67_9ENTR|nr:hypothetical protein FE839_01495 [Klebsiella indica]